jgi:hypothetical protein
LTNDGDLYVSLGVGGQEAMLNSYGIGYGPMGSEAKKLLRKKLKD